MSKAPETNDTELDALRRQLRRLQWGVFVVWPILGIAALLVIFATTRQDAEATRVAINWIESIAESFGRLVLILGGILVILAAVAASAAFAARLVNDFRNRRSRFTLNPGSKLAGPRK